MILLVFRLVILAVLLALVVIPHILFKAITGRGAVGRLFLQAAAWIMGIRVRRIGPPPTAQTLIVANHVSWMDILVLGGTLGCAFVSKAEVKESAFLKWLADQRETLYVDRQARRDIAQHGGEKPVVGLHRDREIDMLVQGPALGPGIEPGVQ